jgi:L-2-hydroxyglutarate oxidase
VHKIDFRVLPLPGTVLMHEGQRYVAVGSDLHTRRDGQIIPIICWQSHCAECGRPFECWSGLRSGTLNRRCPQHHAPGSLKARLCRDGAARTKEYCQHHGIPFEARGKLIVATREEELPRLAALESRAAENGITVERLDGAGIRALEPQIEGLAALHVPTSAIVSYSAVLLTLADELRRMGVEMQMSTQPEAIRESASLVEVETAGGTIRARRLVACAGLQSDRVAQMAGLRLRHRIVPFRGEYYRLRPEKSGVACAMIYPVPDPALPFLGVHLTPSIDGNMTVGPNAVLGLAREGYRKGSVNWHDLVDMAMFPGLWISLGRNVRSGITELGNTLFKRRYLAACQRYCPSLEINDLLPMEPGIRAQAVMQDGTMLHDFLFLDTPRMLHVCNAPSPAATSALPIGDVIADRILGADMRSRVARRPSSRRP